MTNPYGYVYKITNLINGKVYIGQTSGNPLRRWAKHRYNRNSKNYPLYLSMRKHGIHNFEFKTIITCTDRDQLDRCECSCIRLFRSTDMSKGYNLKHGGGGNRIAESTKQKLRLKALNMSDDVKIRISNTMKKIGHKPPQLTKEQLSAYARGRISPRRGKNQPGRPVILNGFIYPSVKVASNCSKIPIKTLGNTLRGRIINNRLGFSIQYLCTGDNCK